MRLKFVDQAYQTDAVNSICDIFEGNEIKDSIFTIDISNHEKVLAGEGTSYNIGHANKLFINDFTMLENVKTIQEHNDIMMVNNLQNKNFSIEMETGERVIIVTGCINVLVSRVSGTLTKYNSCIA